LRILIDLNHPAHLHLFKNLIWSLQHKGHEIQITARKKDVLLELLDNLNFVYQITSESQSERGLLSQVKELVKRELKLLSIARKFNPDLMMGTSSVITHVGKLIRAKSIVFNEDDADVIRAFSTLAYPLADVIVTPTCLDEDYGDRHIKYNGYQKLAYLHPNVFIPTPSILNKLGIKQGESFFIMRLVALQAAHDKGAVGLSLSARRKLIQALSQRGKVFLTNEGPLPEEFEPYRMRINAEDMHDALAFATLLVSDSQTMTAEAAILGTPAIRCNTFVGRISYLEELEHRYQLTYGFRPEDEGKMYAFIINLLDQHNLSEIWQQRRDKMLAEKIDVNAWMINFVESYLNN
jgi:uncharacterized protein